PDAAASVAVATDPDAGGGAVGGGGGAVPSPNNAGEADGKEGSGEAGAVVKWRAFSRSATKD
ncbi:MAG TPA: hypothetical protein VJ779_20380, partial [Acetobacteraceae bacterium]|nr:hypothetical protein [Acetobacteraceae bacterium]